MAEEVELTQPDVMKLCKAYMNPEHLAFVEKAYKFAAYVHKDQVRKSGEPYMSSSHSGSGNSCRIKNGS